MQRAQPLHAAAPHPVQIRTLLSGWLSHQFRHWGGAIGEGGDKGGDGGDGVGGGGEGGGDGGGNGGGADGGSEGRPRMRGGAGGARGADSCWQCAHAMQTKVLPRISLHGSGLDWRVQLARQVGGGGGGTYGTPSKVMSVAPPVTTAP